MSNPEITNNDSSQLEVFGSDYRQDMVIFGTDETKLVGQILGRKILSDTVTQTPDVGNTGDGTVTNQALGSGGPAKVGNYNLECVEAIVNSGRFKLEDPDGKILTEQIIIAVSADIDYEGFGLKFTLADGATDFIIGDNFAIGVSADGGLDSYDPAGLDGTEIPVALMARERTEAIAATYGENVLIKGEVRLDIVETAQGAALSKELKDKLAAIGIITRSQVQLAELDNQ
jgi:hypothetical protein